MALFWNGVGKFSNMHMKRIRQEDEGKAWQLSTVSEALGNMSKAEGAADEKRCEAWFREDRR